jgi:hypothetical protein
MQLTLGLAVRKISVHVCVGAFVFVLFILLCNFSVSKLSFFISTACCGSIFFLMSIHRFNLINIYDFYYIVLYCFFICVCAGGIVSGFSTFAPKYIEFQFSLNSGWAAQLVGKVFVRTLHTLWILIILQF